jgi:CheY-like chemotaxis protein
MYFPALHWAEPTAAVEAADSPVKIGCRVLLVEDNLPLAEVTQQLLETLGCTVRRAASADQAIACLEGDGPVDVVLSDIAMPGSLDGIALGSWIRANRPAIGVVLMTGYAERLDRAVELGLRVIPKPCTPDAMSAALRAAIVGDRPGDSAAGPADA